MTLNRQQRADLVTARGSLRRIEAGYEDVDYATAASMVDRVLATVCPHDAASRHASTDVKTGRPLVACYECGVTWYDDYADVLPG